MRVLSIQRSSILRLTVLYISALSIIALLAVSGQILIQMSLQRQSEDAGVINIAGRQRMLSQKLSKAALALSIAPTEAQRTPRIAELNAGTLLWESSHQGLQQGSTQLNLPGNNSATVTQLYAHIQPNFDAMVGAIQGLLDVAQKNRLESSQAFRTTTAPFIQTILQNEAPFLVGMDKIVSQYEVEANGRVNQLKQIELILLTLTILVLLFEGIFVFRPAIVRLTTALTGLVQAEERASHMLELKRKNEELDLALNEALAANLKVKFPARAVAYGHYQVQGSQGHIYNVFITEVDGNQLLRCECPVYKHNLICSHFMAAMPLHKALIEYRRREALQAGNPPSTRSGNTGPFYNR